MRRDNACVCLQTERALDAHLMRSSGQAMATVDGEMADVVATCGVVVPFGDVVAFAHAVQYLAERPDMRARLGEAARTYAHSHLASDAVLGRLEVQMRTVAGTGAAVTGVVAE